MYYLSAREIAQQWGISVQRVRSLCAAGRIDGAVQGSSGWQIPDTAVRPGEKTEEDIPRHLKVLRAQRKKNNHNGIYEYLQINMSYSSCRMASNRLTREQVIEVYRTGKITVHSEPVKVDDLIEISKYH